MYSLFVVALVAGLAGFAVGRWRIHVLQNEGEAIVASALTREFPSDKFHLMNNVTVRMGEGTTQIDHVLVSVYGVFIVETKKYSGWIFADEKRRTWTQVLHKRKFQFQNPIRQNFKHVCAMRDLLDFIEPSALRGVVVFVGDAVFKLGMPAGVYSLADLISHIRSHSEPVLSVNKMHFCIGRIESARLALTRQTDVEHRRALNIKYGSEG